MSASFFSTRPVVALEMPQRAAIFTVSCQRRAGAVAEIDHRANLRTLHLAVIVDSGHPQIQQDIHFGAAAGADQFCRNHNRHKEKARIFLTGAVVVQHGIMFFPVPDLIFDHLSPVKEKIGDQMAFLQFIQDGDCLALETGTEPCSQFLHGTDPLTGVYRIADTVYAEIGGTEICVVAKHRIIKKGRNPRLCECSGLPLSSG